MSQYISTSCHLQAIILIYGTALMNQMVSISYTDIICKVLVETDYLDLNFLLNRGKKSETECESRQNRRQRPVLKVRVLSP